MKRPARNLAQGQCVVKVGEQALALTYSDGQPGALSLVTFASPSRSGGCPWCRVVPVRCQAP
jgi:hypothetical protein